MDNCLSPINITANSAVNECSNKCDLTYKYSISEPILNMTNNGDHLSYKFTQTDENFAQLDNEIFKLTELQIYSPSLHRYNSMTQIAELLLIHTNITNSSYELIISIPIGQTGAAISDQGFTNLLSISKTYIPTSSSSPQNFLIPSLNINNFIGKTGFYTYNGTHIGGDCLQKASYIVFYPTDFALFISNDYLSDNKISILQPSDYGIVENDYFYNKNEAKYYLGDGVYMDCVAVNTSAETIESPVYSSTFATTFLNSSTTTVIFNYSILTCFLTVLLFLVYIIFFQEWSYLRTFIGQPAKSSNNNYKL